MSYDLTRFNENKMREIERRIHYMRAASPPKDLLNVTSRQNLLQTQKALQGARCATSLSEQMIEKGILNDEYYASLKQTLRKTGPNSPLRSPSRTLGTSYSTQMSSSRTPSSPFDSTFDSTAFFSSQAEERITSANNNNNNNSTTQGETNQPMKEINWNEHPMVLTLGNRGLTSAAAKRKLQANVKREIEESLALKNVAAAIVLQK